LNGPGALEPEAHQGKPTRLHQHHRNQNRPAADPGLRQQPVFELPRRNGRGGKHDYLWPGHHARIHEQPWMCSAATCSRRTRSAWCCPSKDNIDIIASLVRNGKTGDPLESEADRRNIECTSCHNPHVQAKDLVSLNFLVRDSSNGADVPGLPRSHPDNVRPGQSAGRLGHQRACPVQRQDFAPGEPGQLWHGGQPTPVSPAMSRTMRGPARLLRGQNEQDCIACHNGSSNITPMAIHQCVFLSTPRSDIHFPRETIPTMRLRSVLLNNNRHATCVDCHNGHGSETSRAISRHRRLIRISQKDIAGISAADGTSVLTPAINQYENCLRCHGTSSGNRSPIRFMDTCRCGRFRRAIL
jgi:hypothetical protein